MGNAYFEWHGVGGCHCGRAARGRAGDWDRRREKEHGADRRPPPETAACPYCGGSALNRFGRTPRGAQRWHCRTCDRKHQATTGTVLAGIRHPRKFDGLLADMLGPEPSSCRKLARALALDKSTVWHWRQKASRGFVVTKQTTLLQPIQMGVAVVRESRKASREWVNHRRDPAAHPAPDRLRWVDYRRLGLVAPDHLPRYRIPIEISLDRVGRRAAEVLDSLASEHCRPSISADLAADQPTAKGTPRLPTPREEPDKVIQPDAKLPTGAGEVDRLLAELGGFLRPFRGPATRHLPAYVAWFITRNARSEPAGARILYPSSAPD